MYEVRTFLETPYSKGKKTKMPYFHTKITFICSLPIKKRYLNIKSPSIRETAVALRSSVFFLFPSLQLSWFLVVMDQNLGNCDFSKNNDTSKAPMKLMKIGKGKRSFKCSQYDYVFSWTGDLRKHLTMHSGESPTNTISVTMRSLQQATWKDIWRSTVEKSPTNATNVTMHPLKQLI